MDAQPFFSIKVFITIDTMINFDGDFDGNGDVTCKQTFKQRLQTGWSRLNAFLSFLLNFTVEASLHSDRIEADSAEFL